jgi:hypothetical protein
VYRFRSVDRLLGESRELEDQYFFLSSPSDLNDPMEGYQDIVWKGDRILWENLLRHYLLSLLWTVTGLLIMDDKSFAEPDVPATLTEDDLPTEDFRALYGAICAEFFGNPALSSLPDALAGMPVAVRINVPSASLVPDSPAGAVLRGPRSSPPRTCSRRLVCF